MLIQDLEWGETQRKRISNSPYTSPPQPRALVRPQSPPRYDSVSRDLDLEQFKHDLLKRHDSVSMSPAQMIYPAVPEFQHEFDFPSYDDVWIHIHDSVYTTKVRWLLEFFWTYSADTTCMVCGGTFDPEIEGPIRTISLEPPEILPATALSIRVHNRHLSCIRQSSIPFVSISHVWDSAVAKAHVQGPDATLELAAEELFKVIVKILPAISANFSTATYQAEIWHDYFSVPQWNRKIQQQLLAMLPAIFEAADATIIYLHDISASLVLSIAQNAAFSPKETYQNLAAFYSSIWFQRMWVSLEFTRCTQACILTKDMHVFAVDGGKRWDSFAWLLEESRQCARSVLLQVGPSTFFSWFGKSKIPIIGRLLDQRQRNFLDLNSITYGEALSFVAGRNCREYRDKFVAMGCLLMLNSEHPLHISLPQQSAEACLWIAQKCFERGDHSPLLIQQSGESPMAKAPWLVGHENMHEYMWDLGSLVSRPRNAKITMLDKKLHLSLEYVGCPGTLFFITPNSPRELFETALTLILGNANLRTAGHLVSAMGRIFGVPPIARPLDLPIELHDYLRQDPAFTTRLNSLISEYLAPCAAMAPRPSPSPGNKPSKGGMRNAPRAGIRLSKRAKVEEQGGSNTRVTVTTKIMQLLKLEQRLNGAYTTYSRFEFASAAGNWSTSYRDVLAMISCPSCNNRYPYRFSILKRVDQNSLKLFRIPGLGYASSLVDGVGLVMSGKALVGRFIYGTRACDCRNVETVVLDDTRHVYAFSSNY
ncbi:hypothetical protein GQ44DRAFT_168230 [Phaeosphaeriaceae sp. PMI808]|nr:hypothetical protein GQ44DRAFT_168230 [Phaeosphaeriaceae sp. PMI808]